MNCPKCKTLKPMGNTRCLVDGQLVAGLICTSCGCDVVGETIDDHLWWMEMAHDLCRIRLQSDAVDVIFTHVDDLLLNGKFDIVNEILKHVDIDESPVTVLLGYLTITFFARNMLDFRSEFFANVERSFNEKQINEKGLLDGLD